MKFLCVKKCRNDLMDVVDASCLKYLNLLNSSLMRKELLFRKHSKRMNL